MGMLGPAYADKNGVFMIGEELDKMRLGIAAQVSVFPDEEALLTGFVKWMRVQDPGIFTFSSLDHFSLS